MPSGLPREKMKKPMASAALFFNRARQVLIVKPTYKDHWGMPGGAVENDESPLWACIREIKEELSIKLDKAKLVLISVDYVSQGVTSSWGDAIRFVFFAGILSEKQILKIKLQESELEKMEFLDVSELPKRLSAHTARAIVKSVEAHKGRKVFYLENGNEIV